MPKLTDIKAPDARLYNGPQPPKKPRYKKAIRWLLAPIVWPVKIFVIWPVKYLVWWPIKLVFKAIAWLVKVICQAIMWLLKILIIKPVLWLAKFIVVVFRGIKKIILWIWIRIKVLVGAVISGIRNLFSAIGSGFKSALKAPRHFWTGFKNIGHQYLPNNWAGWLVFILALIVIGQILHPLGLLPLTSRNKWQAVFLTNNQVYFGHLKESRSDYTVLKEAYYLKSAPDDKTKVDLVKLGDELHGPEQAMYIPKNQILFWENLKPDSQVVQAIKRLRGK